MLEPSLAGRFHMLKTPDLEHKLNVLMTLATEDREGMPPRLRNMGAAGALGPVNIRTLAPLPGMKIRLLRILMTNACSYNCHYCPMRRDREMPRVLLKPEELVRIFLGARARGWCDGLFITTGIPGRPTKVAGDLIEVLELLRLKHRFNGYIHVKLVIGAEEAQIERLTALANRVSLNLEAPCGASLTQIAPDKNLDTTIANLEKVRTLVAAERIERGYGRPADPLRPSGASGMTAQFVVGATADTDRTLLTSVAKLHGNGEVHHVHFSAFRPIIDTPMENVAATPALREHRLYQAEHLLRDYDFSVEELVTGENGNLPLTRDPKLAWALQHPERFPVELNDASFEQLLRVPGIGRTGAKKIVRERRGTVIRSLKDLNQMGIQTTRAAGFLMLRGRKLGDTRWTEQLGFWEPEDEVGMGHVRYKVSPGTFR
jgi:predicted DNA-binding helix-hairpin-helix protein